MHPQNLIKNSFIPYSFHGMEHDNQVKGEGNSYDFGARLLDPRVGRFLSVDPLVAIYPGYSPYAFCADNPIIFIDPDGRKIEYADKEAKKAIKPLLKKMKGQSSAMKRAYKMMKQSDNIVTFATGESNMTFATNSVTDEATGEKGIPQGAVDGSGTDVTITIDISDKFGGIDVNGNQERPIEAGISQEIGHALSFISGTYHPGLQPDAPGINSDGTPTTLDNFPKEEYFGAILENLYRGQSGEPLVKYYPMDDTKAATVLFDGFESNYTDADKSKVKEDAYFADFEKTASKRKEQYKQLNE